MTPTDLTWLAMMTSRVASDAPAVMTETENWSGAELMARAAGGADLLDQVGAPVGAPVMALLSSRPSSFALAIGAAATDRALAPLGPRLTASELIPCIESLNSEVLIVESDFEPLARLVAGQRRVVVLAELPASSRSLSFDAPPGRAGAILHTSGTTGLPKPVVYHQGGLGARARVNSELVMLGPGAIYASASPFHHIAGIGMLFVALGAGACLHPLPSFTVDSWRALGRRGVTHALLVPTMIESLLRHDALALPELRVLQYGASPIHPDTLAAAMDALPGVKLVNMYGQTEGSPITCLDPSDHERALRGRPDLLTSVGRAAPGVEMFFALPDEHGVGEVVARAVHFFKPDTDGWLRTGDLGRIDAHGYLYLSGRKGDMIIRGGENVYPMEVENALVTHPAVAEACVYGLADKKWGQIVAASVVLNETIVWDDLRAYVRERLAGFKVPVTWDAVDALPRNMAGKVLRRDLIAQHTPH